MNLRSALLEIRDQNAGVITPEIVKEAVRPKSHPLHGRVFDRTVKEAAEEYYTSRAYELIRACRISMPTLDPNDRRTLRAFQAIPSTEGTQEFTYEPTEEVAADPVRREILLRQMERDVAAMVARYQDFAEFWKLLAERVAVA